MLTITFSKAGPAHPDNYCEEFIKKVKRLSNMEKDQNIIISNEILVTAIRAAIRQGKIDQNKLRFKFNKELLHVNKDGRFIDPIPEGFCDVHEKYLGILLI